MAVTVNPGVALAQHLVERVVLHFDALLRHGCSNPAHIAENHDIFDFELSDDEMARIASLNRNEKHDWY